MTNYPRVLSEGETLELALKGQNLARYGDGELKLCAGRDCVSQPADPRLAKELKGILVAPAPGCLPCIPNIKSATPKISSWRKFADPVWTALYRADIAYGSSFITRPDSAPWIDTPDYWARVTDIWRRRDVVLVAGTMRSLRPDMLTEAASVRLVDAPSGQKRDGAYAKVNELQEAVGKPSGPVMLCVGATSTVLADRFARAGVWAIDLGHIGMFMRAAGAYRVTREELISPAYAALLVEMHANQKWGHTAHKRASDVSAFAAEIEADSILDYGCGQGSLKTALAAGNPPRRAIEYDPGVPGKDSAPKPSALVACIDVLEHVEPDHLDAVLQHIRNLALKGAYLSIATRPANKKLPDGRNAHLIVKPADWWLAKLEALGWVHVRPPAVIDNHDLTVWLRRNKQ